MQKRLAVLFVALSLVLVLFMAFPVNSVRAANDNTKHAASTSTIQLVSVAMGRCGELCNDNGPL
jgi:hypothetical protein